MRYPIAGVNGDFFVQTPGRSRPPVGALVVGGEEISTPYPRSAFILGPEGPYGFGDFASPCGSNGSRRAGGVLKESRGRVARGRRLTGVNQPCGANDLVLYTPRFGPPPGPKPRPTK